MQLVPVLRLASKALHWRTNTRAIGGCIGQGLVTAAAARFDRGMHAVTPAR